MQLSPAAKQTVVTIVELLLQIEADSNFNSPFRKQAYAAIRRGCAMRLSVTH